MDSDYCDTFWFGVSREPGTRWLVIKYWHGVFPHGSLYRYVMLALKETWYPYLHMISAAMQMCSPVDVELSSHLIWPMQHCRVNGAGCGFAVTGQLANPSDC